MHEGRLRQALEQCHNAHTPPSVHGSGRAARERCAAVAAELVDIGSETLVARAHNCMHTRAALAHPASGRRVAELAIRLPSDGEQHDVDQVSQPPARLALLPGGNAFIQQPEGGSHTAAFARSRSCIETQATAARDGTPTKDPARGPAGVQAATTDTPAVGTVEERPSPLH